MQICLTGSPIEKYNRYPYIFMKISIWIFRRYDKRERPRPIEVLDFVELT